MGILLGLLIIVGFVIAYAIVGALLGLCAVFLEIRYAEETGYLHGDGTLNKTNIIDTIQVLTIGWLPIIFIIVPIFAIKEGSVYLYNKITNKVLEFVDKHTEKVRVEKRLKGKK